MLAPFTHLDSLVFRDKFPTLPKLVLKKLVLYHEGTRLNTNYKPKPISHQDALAQPVLAHTAIWYYPNNRFGPTPIHKYIYEHFFGGIPDKQRLINYLSPYRRDVNPYKIALKNGDVRFDAAKSVYNKSDKLDSSSNAIDDKTLLYYKNILIEAGFMSLPSITSSNESNTSDYYLSNTDPDTKQLIIDWLVSGGTNPILARRVIERL